MILKAVLKKFKKIRLTALIMGIVLIVGSLIWFALDPKSMNPLGPFFIGVSLLFIDLLSLVISFFNRVLSIRTKSRNHRT